MSGSIEQIRTTTTTGHAAEDAAVSGNPLLVGGRYDTSDRTLDNGDVGAVAVDAAGRTLVTPVLYNGATYDKQRGTEVINVLSLATHGSGSTSSLITTYNATGMILYLRISAIASGSPTLALEIREVAEAGEEQLVWKDQAGNAIGFADKTATGRDNIRIYPGLVQKLSGTERHYSSVIPRRYFTHTTVSGGTMTFEVKAVHISG